MSVILPTEKVQDMIAKLQEYHASVLVKIDEKKTELEALLCQKLERARLEERGRCALLVQSLAKQHAENRLSGSSCPPRAGLPQLRITTPPPVAASSASPEDANESATSATTALALTATRGEAATGPAHGAVRASLLDTVVLSPVSAAGTSVNQSYTSWLPSVEAFLAMAEDKDPFPRWSFDGDTPAPRQTARVAGPASTPQACAPRRVRFSSRSPQVAVFSVERSLSGMTPPPTASHPAQPGPRVGERLSFSSDSTTVPSSRSSAEIRTDFHTDMAAVQSDISTARSLLDGVAQPTGRRVKSARRPSSPPCGRRAPSVEEAATPTSAHDSPHQGWLDPLTPQDTDAAESQTSPHRSPSFTGTPFIRPPVLNAVSRRSGNASVTVNLSALPNRTAQDSLALSDTGRDVGGLHLARKVRIAEVRAPQRTSKSHARPCRSGPRDKATLSPRMATRTASSRSQTQNPLQTCVRGLCGNISLPCGPTLYFSD